MYKVDFRDRVRKALGALGEHSSIGILIKDMLIAYNKSFEDLRDAFMDKVRSDDGAHCPCCGQWAKIYTRKFNANSARGLIRLHKASSEIKEFRNMPFVHVTELGLTGNGDFAQAAHWGLIEQETNDDRTKKHSGMWRITESGRDFVLGMKMISSHVVLYDGSALSFADTKIDIKDALGKKFDYQELMNT